jgi:glucose dehydrogenase
VHSTPVVVKDTVLIGSAMKEGMTVHTSNNTKGLARAFDARTGKLIWAFQTIPKPGEVGNESWLNNSWAINGNTGVWTQITVDEELGLVYLPVEDPTSDYYGAKPCLCRPRDGEAQVALPVRAPPDLGPRHLVGADHRRRDRERPSEESGGGAEQTGVAVGVRSCDR